MRREGIKPDSSASLSALGTHLEGESIVKAINEGESFRTKALSAIALLGAATAVATVVASVPEPDTKTFGIKNPNACADTPQGVNDVEQYREACRALVAACGIQAELLQDLSGYMSEGPQGPDADKVVGLEEEARRQRDIMDSMVHDMDMASGGTKPEKIVCANEGQNMGRPFIERTARRWHRPQNR